MPPTTDLKIKLAAELLRGGRSVQIRAMGTSMLPTLWPGDLLTVESFDPAHLRIGDIICFHREGRLFIHRLVDARNQSAWITRGDASPCEDQSVVAEEVLGRVIRAERNGRALELSSHLSTLPRLIGRLLDRCDPVRSLVLRLCAVRSRLQQQTSTEPLGVN